jgi:hypothetical protein
MLSVLMEYIRGVVGAVAILLLIGWLTDKLLNSDRSRNTDS